MKKFILLNLQMFADGGGSGAAAGTGGEGGASEGAVTTAGKGDSLSDVIYGKQTTDAADPTNGDNTNTPKSKSQSFEDLIKGEYKDEYTKRTQQMINKRFKETKQMEEKLNSLNSITSLLSEKYGVDATDAEALRNAIESDQSFFEDEALKEGLTVEQYKEVRELRRENQQFKEAEEEARRKENSDRIYAEWTQQAQDLAAKYGLENFDLEQEVLNPDFTRLLSSGISVESAYKAIHMDEMLEGGMRKTAENVRSQLANSIAARQARPAENGVSRTNSSQIFKTDVNALTKADRDEIERRVMRGATISF